MSNTLFRKSRRLWDNFEKCDRARQATDDTLRRMRFACWITKATDTHSDYVILIAFLWQQWLRERASMLRYTYIARLAYYSYRYPWSSWYFYKPRSSHEDRCNEPPLHFHPGDVFQFRQRIVWRFKTTPGNALIHNALLITWPQIPVVICKESCNLSAITKASQPGPSVLLILHRLALHSEHSMP